MRDMRSYEQYCPLARALDVVGDRWTLLVLRELFLSPKRFTDIEQRLPGIAPNLLSARLKDLESAGLVTRRRLDPPAASTVYKLTGRGRSLESALLELSRWGVQFLGSYSEDKAFNIEWLVPVLDEAADREAARGVWETYEFRIDNSRMWARISDGHVTVRAGEPEEPADLTVETDLQTFVGLGFHTISPEEAIASGRMRVSGDVEAGRRALAILSPARILTKMSAA
jgi:DNA-binding HxlR family transcriptional regulator/putative sterol carrier protein